MTINKNQLRQQIREQILKQRAELPKREQQIAQQKVATYLLDYLAQSNPQKIAIYLTHKNELNTKKIIDKLWQKHIQIYLPLLHPFSKGQLLFQKFMPTTITIKNKYGIAEPKLNLQQIGLLNEFDIILTPLVAFDNAGNRLGMGGGFYDRAFTQPHRSEIIGLAYDFQLVEQLPIEPWDKAINKVVTPSGIRQF